VIFGGMPAIDRSAKAKGLGISAQAFEFSGEPCRIRTCDPLIKSQLLYQLS
jgi:hypothetical protein